MKTSSVRVSRYLCSQGDSASVQALGRVKTGPTSGLSSWAGQGGPASPAWLWCGVGLVASGCAGRQERYGPLFKPLPSNACPPGAVRRREGSPRCFRLSPVRPRPVSRVPALFYSRSCIQLSWVGGAAAKRRRPPQFWAFDSAAVHSASCLPGAPPLALPPTSPVSVDGGGSRCDALALKTGTRHLALSGRPWCGWGLCWCTLPSGVLCMGLWRPPAGLLPVLPYAMH